MAGREAVFSSFEAQVNGGPVPQGVWWLQRANDYLGACLTVLKDAHTGWADLVDRYRDHKMPLEEVFASFGASFERLLTILVHAHARADHAQAGDILDVPRLAATPAARLYLKPPAAFLEELRSWPPLAPRERVAEMEAAITTAGETAILEIWRRFGLRPEEGPDRTWALWVDAPAR